MSRVIMSGSRDQREPISLAVIGAGALGRRHVQAIGRLSCAGRLMVVDRDAAAARRVAEQFETERAEDCHLSVQSARDIRELPRELDVVVVATTADVRRSVMETVLDRCTVGAFLLEKILFQSRTDLALMGERLRSASTLAYVNCPRRMWPGYQEVRQRLAGHRLLHVSVTGSDWGLACNTIHFLDLFQFLFPEKGLPILDEKWLDPGEIPARRPGFIELTGAIVGRWADGGTLAIHSHAKSAGEIGIPLTVRLECEGLCAEIAEGSEVIFMREVQDDRSWSSTRHTFETRLQSALTNVAIAGLVAELRGDLTRRCPLTPYGESSELHRLFLDLVARHLSASRGEDVAVCPIT